MIPLGVLAGRRASGGPLDAEYVTVATSTADETTYTFTGTALGAPSADRRIVLAIGARAAANRTVLAVTIGGVAATIDAHAFASGSTTAFASAHVPTGVTGDVVVTLNNSAVRAGVGIWRVTGGALKVADTDVNTATSGTVTVDIPPGGVAFAAVTGSTATPVSLSPADYATQIGTESGSVAGSIITGSATWTAAGTPQAIAIAYRPA